MEQNWRRRDSGCVTEAGGEAGDGGFEAQAWMHDGGERRCDSGFKAPICNGGGCLPVAGQK
ncbi:uncharacterized protein DS421_12g380740 [Arachis hypogaea]|nr:uncharacterized protein DS421_12g380740 [Arachis hypogaea]